MITAQLSEQEHWYSDTKGTSQRFAAAVVPGQRAGNSCRRGSSARGAPHGFPQHCNGTPSRHRISNETSPYRIRHRLHVRLAPAVHTHWHMADDEETLGTRCFFVRHPRPFVVLSAEAPSPCRRGSMWSPEQVHPMLQEEAKLPIDLQSKNTMINVKQNKAAIDYCECSSPFPKTGCTCSGNAARCPPDLHRPTSFSP